MTTNRSPDATLPAGLPPGSRIEHVALPTGEALEVLTVPLAEPGADDGDEAGAATDADRKSTRLNSSHRT